MAYYGLFNNNSKLWHNVIERTGNLCQPSACALLTHLCYHLVERQCLHNYYNHDETAHALNKIIPELFKSVDLNGSLEYIQAFAACVGVFFDKFDKQVYYLCVNHMTRDPFLYGLYASNLQNTDVLLYERNNITTIPNCLNKMLNDHLIGDNINTFKFICDNFVDDTSQFDLTKFMLKLTSDNSKYCPLSNKWYELLLKYNWFKREPYLSIITRGLKLKLEKTRAKLNELETINKCL